MTKINWFFLILVIMASTSCSTGFYVLERDNDKLPAQARLTDAYSTFDRCGSKGRYSCEVFKGRYWLPDHKLVVDKDIDGFVYKAYRENGRAELQIIEFSRSTLEGRASVWWLILCAAGITLNLMIGVRYIL